VEWAIAAALVTAAGEGKVWAATAVDREVEEAPAQASSAAVREVAAVLSKASVAGVAPPAALARAVARVEAAVGEVAAHEAAVAEDEGEEGVEDAAGNHDWNNEIVEKWNDGTMQESGKSNARKK
jgi:hypothetical protein